MINKIKGLKGSDIVIRINANANKIDNHIIGDFQDKYNLRLPYDYVDFLIEYNGGIPYKNEIKGSNYGLSVQVFFGFGLRNDIDIEYNYNLFVKDSHKDYLPILQLEFGDLILINMRKKDFGSILWWQHETYETIKLFNSFKDLLNSVVEYDPEIDLDEVEVLSSWIDPAFQKKLNEKN